MKWLASLFLAFTASAAMVTNTVTFTLTDAIQQSLSNSTLTLQSVNAPRTNSPFIAANFVAVRTVSNGVVVFTNLIPASYRATVSGNGGTTFYVRVPTNNPATHNASTLIVSTP